MLRLPWEKTRTYPIKVAGRYKNDWDPTATSSSPPGIADRPEYNAAKMRADAEAALKIVKKSLSTAYINDLKLFINDMESKGYDKPVLLAPYKQNSKNMIARTFAAYVAEKTGLEVDTDVVILPGKKSQREKGSIFERMANPPQFGGDVRGKKYIVMEDMISSGGTLSALRSYIDQNGGRYLFACSLASVDGKSCRLDPVPQMVDRVYDNLGSKLVKWVENRVGFEISALTGPEARFLASRGGAEEVSLRARIAPG